MTNARGRRTAPLVLEADEREYLERQVRRRRIARSMSERCRIILRCADGSYYTGLTRRPIEERLSEHQLRLTSLFLFQFA